MNNQMYSNEQGLWDRGFSRRQQNLTSLTCDNASEFSVDSSFAISAWAKVKGEGATRGSIHPFPLTIQMPSGVPLFTRTSLEVVEGVPVCAVSSSNYLSVYFYYLDFYTRTWIIVDTISVSNYNQPISTMRFRESFMICAAFSDTVTITECSFSDGSPSAVTSQSFAAVGAYNATFCENGDYPYLIYCMSDGVYLASRDEDGVWSSDGKISTSIHEGSGDIQPSFIIDHDGNKYIFIRESGNPKVIINSGAASTIAAVSVYTNQNLQLSSALINGVPKVVYTIGTLYTAVPIVYTYDGISSWSSQTLGPSGSANSRIVPIDVYGDGGFAVVTNYIGHLYSTLFSPGEDPIISSLVTGYSTSGTQNKFFDIAMDGDKMWVLYEYYAGRKEITSRDYCGRDFQFDKLNNYLITGEAKSIIANNQPCFVYSKTTSTYTFRGSIYDGETWDDSEIESSLVSYISAAEIYGSLATSYVLGSDLKYSRWNGASWDSEVVGSLGYSGSAVALIWGAPAIATSVSGDVYFYRWNGSSWDVEDTGFNGSNVYALFEIGGLPHIFYLYSGILYCIKWNGVSWETYGYYGFSSAPTVVHARMNDNNELYFLVEDSSTNVYLVYFKSGTFSGTLVNSSASAMGICFDDNDAPIAIMSDTETNSSAKLIYMYLFPSRYDVETEPIHSYYSSRLLTHPFLGEYSTAAGTAISDSNGQIYALFSTDAPTYIGDYTTWVLNSSDYMTLERPTDHLLSSYGVPVPYMNVSEIHTFYIYSSNAYDSERTDTSSIWTLSSSLYAVPAYFDRYYDVAGVINDGPVVVMGTYNAVTPSLHVKWPDGIGGYNDVTTSSGRTAYYVKAELNSNIVEAVHYHGAALYHSRINTTTKAVVSENVYITGCSGKFDAKMINGTFACAYIYGGDLYYAEFNGSTWSSSIIELEVSGLKYDSYSSISLADIDDKPSIAVWVSDSNFETVKTLTYVSYNGSSWNFDCICNESLSRQETSMTYLDMAEINSQPAVVFCLNDENDQDRLVYARYSGTNWDFTNISSSANALSSPKLVESGTSAAILYVDVSYMRACIVGAPDTTVREESPIVKKPGCYELVLEDAPLLKNYSFTLTQSDGAEKTVRGLAIRNNDWHHVCAIGTGSTLYLYVDNVLKDSISYDGTIKTNGKKLSLGGYGSKLGFDLEFMGIWKDVSFTEAQRNNFVNYLFNTEEGRRFEKMRAHWNGPKPITLTTSTGVYNDLFMVGDVPHVSYQNASTQELCYATRSGSTWTVEVASTSGNDGWYSGIVVISTVPYIVFYRLDTGDLMCAYKSGMWTVEAVDTTVGAYVGSYASAAVVGGAVAAAYYDFTNGNLKYASRSGGTWSYETVESTGNVGLYTSLYEVNSQPAISYYDATNKQLKYARYNGATWDIAVVDTVSAEVGQYTSLKAIGNNPCIAYYDVTQSSLKYAAYNGATWDVETVSSTGLIGKYASLCIIASKPCISCWNDTDNSLRYFRWDGSVWHDEEFVGPFFESTACGTYCRIAAGTQYPSIVFRDDTNLRPMYIEATSHIFDY